MGRELQLASMLGDKFSILCHTHSTSERGTITIDKFEENKTNFSQISHGILSCCAFLKVTEITKIAR